MKRRPKATTRLQSVLDPTLEKPLLHLHAAIDVDSFWKGVQDVIEAALPNCFIGLTLQHSPILPRIAKSTQKLPGSFFPIMPIKKYFSTHPHRNDLFINDFFSDERHFRRSSFYRGLYRANKRPMCHWLILLGYQAPPRLNHCRAQRATRRAVTGRNKSDWPSPFSISNGTSPAAFALARTGCTSSP